MTHSKPPSKDELLDTVYTNAKAGMGSVDKEKVKRVVYEMSKVSFGRAGHCTSACLSWHTRRIYQQRLVHTSQLTNITRPATYLLHSLSHLCHCVGFMEASALYSIQTWSWRWRDLQRCYGLVHEARRTSGPPAKKTVGPHSYKASESAYFFSHRQSCFCAANGSSFGPTFAL